MGDEEYAIFDEPVQEDSDEGEEEASVKPEEEKIGGGYVSEESEGPREDLTGLEAEPSYKKYNNLKFCIICQKLETLDSQKQSAGNKKNKMSKKEKLELLLPPMGLEKCKPCSPFPLFRLLMPDRDTSRKTTTKEGSLSDAYSAVLGYDKKTPKEQALKHFTNPNVVNKAGFSGPPPPPSGDFSILVEYAVRDRDQRKPSRATIGDINEALDQLVAGLAASRKSEKGTSGANSSQMWRSSQSQYSSQRRSQSKKKKKETAKAVREKFVRTLDEKLKLSPKEHKWLVRILLEDIKIGVGSEAILAWYSPHANDLWKHHNSLKAVCDKASNEAYIKQREKDAELAEQRMKEQRFSQLYEVPMNPDPLMIGNTISAMRSDRTSFEGCMADMAAKFVSITNRKADKGVLQKLPQDDPVKGSLALKFPAFISEVKLDGERMLVHIQRGEVTMHTRQGRWYSPLYSPIVGPALRRAIARYDLDLILDGEILAWNNKAGEVIEFGSNRTVAILRQKWLGSRGEIEEIDKRLHAGQQDAYVIEFDEAKKWNFDREKEVDSEEMEGGAQCWVKFVAFDVLLVGGPDAQKALAESLSPDPPPSEVGSITHLSLFERKRVLYNLIEEQRNEIEIVESVVIRPNGECAKAEAYFASSNPIMECDLPAHTLDSAKWTLNVGHPSLIELDKSRKKGRTDLEISQRRTTHVNDFYHHIVNKKKLEGLVFKDLASPYVLRSKTGVWKKIKPDYSNDSFASDIDVVVVGASYGVGTWRGGKIASFLCACVDSEHPGRFMTFCRLNAKSLNELKLDELMEHTGFKEEEGELGAWFIEADYDLPDFLSQRSLQYGKETQNGWDFDRVKNYPDLWIRPKDSFVLTVNASEIVTSNEYSAGITLRFPRATRPRLGADAKDASEVESDDKLTELLHEYKTKMKKYATGTNSAFEIVSPSKPKRSKDGRRDDDDDDDEKICQFLTVEQCMRRQEQKRKRPKAVGRVKLVRMEKQKSNALLGIKFHVIEGAYNFDPEGLDAEQARAEGWFEDAEKVDCASDVETFIMMHGGQVVRTTDKHDDTYIVGGSSDFKVANLIEGMDRMKVKLAKKRKKEGVKVENTNLPGVLKWTYVLSLVKRWENEVQRRLQDAELSSDEEEDGEFENNDECILKNLPDLLQPRFFDFLAQSKVYGDSSYESVWRYGALDTTTMKQALSLLQDDVDTDPKNQKKQRADEAELVPWQSSALNCLSQDNRWIMSCQYEKLWPYGDSSADSSAFSCVGDEKQPVLVYPDLFGNDFGLPDNNFAGRDLDAAERWEQAPSSRKNSATASSLPLLRCMGSRVTFHLAERVTHVLCDLASTDSARWHPGDFLDVFEDKDHGRKLQERLEETVGHTVLLITRAWVNSTFDMKGEADA